MRIIHHPLRIFSCLIFATFVAVTGCSDGGGQMVTVTLPEAVQLSFTAKTSGQLVRFNMVNEAELDRVLEWRWDFGDGSESTEASPVHRYSDSGDYSVRLSWVDTAMRTPSKTETVTVTPYDNVELDWDLVLGKQDLANTSLEAGPPGFVITGKLGKLLFSENGFDWGEVATHMGVDLRFAIWSQNAFWAFGRGYYFTFDPDPIIYSVHLTSSDGRDWTPMSAPPGVTTAIASNGTTLVAVGQNGSTGTIHVSLDGGAWQRVLRRGSGLSSVSWTGTTFVAVGYVAASRIDNPSYFTIVSEDGINWRTHESSIDPVFFPTATDGTRFVRLAHNIETSDDGLAWAPTQVELPEPLHAVAWGEGRFVAIGRNYVLTSTSGQTWETHALPVQLDRDSGLTFSGGVWLIHAPSGPVLWSGNGYEWAPYPSAENPPPQRHWLAATPWRDGFAVGAEQGLIATSDDGRHWEEQTIQEDFQVRDLLEIDGRIWASGVRTGTERNTVFRQTEGDWQPVFSAEQPLLGIAHLGSKVFVAEESGRLYSADLPEAANWELTGEFGAIVRLQVIDETLVLLGQRQLFTSQDGTIWQGHELPLRGTYAVCKWDGAWFVAGLNHDEIYKATTLLRSEDLATWEPIPFDLACRIRHLVPGESKLVATGDYAIGRFGIQSDQPFDLILTSPDGFTWQPETSPLGKVPAALTFNHGRFIAAGDGFVWRHEDQ